MSVEVTVRASNDSFAEAIKNLRTILSFLEAVPQSSQVSDGQWRPVKVGNVEIGAVAVGADVIGKRAMYLRPSGSPKPAFETGLGSALDKAVPMDHTSELIRCGNEGCGEPIERVQGQYKYPWRHVETEDRFCDVSPKNPAYGKSATPPTA